MIRQLKTWCSLVGIVLLSASPTVQSEGHCGTVEKLQISPVFSLEQRIFVEAALCRSAFSHKQVLVVSGMAYDGIGVKTLWTRHYPVDGQVLAMGFEADGPASTIFIADQADAPGLRIRVDLSTMELTDIGFGSLSRLQP